MSKIFYKGFSSNFWNAQNKSFVAINKEIVKRDLLNHIFTVKGERVMMPNFGTRIPSLAFEPIDARTLRIIEDDIKEVIDYDPRVKLQDLKILPMSDNNAIIVYCTVLYVELGGVETFNIEVRTGTN